MTPVRRTISAVALALLLAVGSTATAGPPAGAVTLTTGDRYVALGDSFTAGAVPWYALDVQFGAWAVGEWINSGFSSWAHLCGRATSNPWTARVLTEATASGTPTRVNGSCGGATTAHITAAQTANTQINGWQTINQQQRNHITSATDVVTLTLGGNDAELLRLISQCVGAADCTDDTGPWDTISGTGAGTIQTKLDAAYDAIEARISSVGATAEVVVVQYSSFVPDETERTGSGDDCDALYGIDADETEHVADITKELNQAIATAAAGRTGWSVVDLYGPSQDGVGHDMCAGNTNKWVTGPTAGETASVAWTYNGSGQVYPLHLNDAGHIAYGDIVGDAVVAA